MRASIYFEDGDFLFMARPETDGEKKLMDSCFKGVPLNSFEADSIIGKTTGSKDFDMALVITLKRKCK